MTLLNTVSNLGGIWPPTVVLWLGNPLTMKEYVGLQDPAVGLQVLQFWYRQVNFHSSMSLSMMLL